ncbi:DoxX family protein [Fodinibius halophilus]|uniref:DoxX family protein n=1 Tax=Fodinibius halophilus TaxID=1736908 RepID=A0A6M1THG7_9BACT|nr:DoxX family protein [Fodinibius halophilus]NGP89552.1 DoxX family protein [Fodinibius halophilus]
MLNKRKRNEFRDVGLLILRIGLGIMFIIHGYPKMFGGPEVWSEIGTAVQYLGIDFAPMFFGFMAGVTEFFGGIFLILGLFFSPTVFFLLVVMLVAAAQHLGAGDSFASYSHSIEMGVVFLSLIFIGPGTYSLDKKLQEKRRHHRY